MIVEQDKVILEQKDLEKLFRFVIQESLGGIGLKFKLIFVLSEDFSIDDINFTIPDVKCIGGNGTHLHYKFIITEDDTPRNAIEYGSLLEIRTMFDYYLVEYDRYNPSNKGIIIDIDKEEISKLKLML